MSVVLTVLVMGTVVMSGCTGTVPAPASPVSTTAPTAPVPTAVVAQDPLVGVWGYFKPTAVTSATADEIIRFNADGTFVNTLVISIQPMVMGAVEEKTFTECVYGTWSAQGDNAYATKDVSATLSSTGIATQKTTNLTSANTYKYNPALKTLKKGDNAGTAPELFTPYTGKIPGGC